MKKLINSVCICVLLLASTVVAAGTFEGEVNFAMTSGKDKPMAMNYRIKGDKLGIEMPDQKDIGGMIMVNEEMYMVTAMPDPAEAQAKKQSDGWRPPGRPCRQGVGKSARGQESIPVARRRHGQGRQGELPHGGDHHRKEELVRRRGPPRRATRNSIWAARVGW